MPLFDLITAGSVLRLLLVFVEDEKRVELAHLGLRIDRLGEGIYVPDRYRIIKTFDLPKQISFG